jgi:hypothetical protein
MAVLISLDRESRVRRYQILIWRLSVPLNSLLPWGRPEASAQKLFEIFPGLWGGQAKTPLRVR